MQWGVVTDYTNGKRITTTVSFGCRRPIIWGMKRRIVDKNEKDVSVVGLDVKNPLAGLPPAEIIVSWANPDTLPLGGRVCQKIWYVVESMLFNKFNHPIFLEPIETRKRSDIYKNHEISLRSPYQAHILMPIILHLLFGVVNKVRVLSTEKLNAIDKHISDPNGDIKEYYKHLCTLPIWNHDSCQTLTRDALIEKGIKAFWPKVEDEKNLLREIWNEYGVITTVDNFCLEKVRGTRSLRSFIEGEWREEITNIKV